MTVTKKTSTNGAYVAWYSDQTTLATAIQDLINALDTEQVPIDNVEIITSSYHDGSNTHYLAVGICKRH